MAVADDRADLPGRRSVRPEGTVVGPLRPAPALNAIFAHGNAELAGHSGPDRLVGRGGTPARGAPGAGVAPAAAADPGPAARTSLGVHPARPAARHAATSWSAHRSL